MEKHLKWLFFPFLLFAVLPLFPGLTVFTIIITSIVFAFYTAKYGLQFSAVGLPILFIIITLLFGVQMALFISLYCIPAFVLGALLYKKVTFSALLITSAVSMLFVLVLHSLMVSKSLGTEPAQWLFQDSVEQMQKVLLSSEQMDMAMASEMELMLRQFTNMMQTMLPCFYILFALCLVYLLFNIVRFMLKKQNIHLDTMPRFYELWLPKSISVIFIILFLISMFTDSPILLNVVSVMFSVHAICGLALADFYLVKRKMPKVLRILILGILLAFSTVLGGVTSTILCFMGMNDGMRVVRK